MTARILINRGGGSVGDRAAVEAAMKGAGIEGTARWLDGPELAEAAEAAVAQGAKLVVAGGGDGTMSAVARALAGSDTRLGILPLGTLNHFARDLGIPLDLDAAAGLIAQGRDRRVDVAEVNGRVFINNSAVGLYPLMVRDREAQQSKFGRSKRWAMAVAAARTLLRFSSQRLILTVNKERARVDTPLLFVGNNAYRLEMPGAGTRERLDGGELSVILLRRKSRFGFYAATARALIGRDRTIDFERMDGVRLLRVDSALASLAISIDGETERVEAPLVYRIRPKALRVIAP
jgi:diacylglycerol kinase family enzyme